MTVDDMRQIVERWGGDFSLSRDPGVMLRLLATAGAEQGFPDVEQMATEFDALLAGLDAETAERLRLVNQFFRQWSKFTQLIHDWRQAGFGEAKEPGAS